MQPEWLKVRNEIVSLLDRAILQIVSYNRFPEPHLVELVEKLVAIKETFMHRP